MYKNVPRTNLYAFNIICEAKLRTLFEMTKQFHPEMSDKEVAKFLINAITNISEQKSG